jgi:hypothetical protein
VGLRTRLELDEVSFVRRENAYHRAVFRAAVIGMFLGALVALAIACGDVLTPDRPPTSGTDLDGSTDAPTDRGVPSDLCDPSHPFGAPVLVPGLPHGLGVVRFSEDERTAYYHIGREIFRAERNAEGYPGGVSFGPTGQCPSPSADESVLFYEVDWQVFEMRVAAAGVGDAGALVPSIPSRLMSCPFYAESQRALYVTLYHTDAFFQRFSTAWAPVSADHVVGNFNELDFGSDQEHTPVPSADGTSVYFSTFRSAGADAGWETSFAEHDIWKVSRSPNGQLENPEIVPNVNSADYDAPMWTSADNCRLYILSLRNTLKDPGSDAGPVERLTKAEVFVARRTP